MPIRTDTRPPGTPCWAELTTADPRIPRAFYSELFGWEFQPGTAETGGYTIAVRDGIPVAGIALARPGRRGPATWTTFLASPDVDAAAARARELGGAVIATPGAIGQLARTARLRDPGGAEFGVWQDTGLGGFGLVDEPGAFGWFEVMTRSYADCGRFYADIFGVDLRAQADAEDVDVDVEGEPAGTGWSLMSTAEGAVAGLGEIDPAYPAQVPAHWMAYLAVEQLELAVALALDHGATLLGDPYEGAGGPAAVLTGPQGDTFAMVQRRDSGLDPHRPR